MNRPPLLVRSFRVYAMISALLACTPFCVRQVRNEVLRNTWRFELGPATVEQGVLHIPCEFAYDPPRWAMVLGLMHEEVDLIGKPWDVKPYQEGNPKGSATHVTLVVAEKSPSIVDLVTRSRPPMVAYVLHYGDITIPMKELPQGLSTLSCRWEFTTYDRDPAQYLVRKSRLYLKCFSDDELFWDRGFVLFGRELEYDLTAHTQLP